MGLAGSAGSLIPFFQIEDAFSQPAFPYVIGGIIISLVGVFLTAKAGIERDKLNSSKSKGNNITKGIFNCSYMWIIILIIKCWFC